ncbi:MAG: GNAT family N-acetyltransferase [Armatimonadetes bacterium]|nr:GNAT family N-acetyltransferase [Armatimonadota bacterium]
MAEIRPARFPEDLETVRELFREYQDSIGVDLCFQDFENELAGLPGKYEPPSGSLLMAWHEDRPVGCVAMRPVAGDDCEMKRLYVRPAGRGQGLGRRLTEKICEEARTAGYRRMFLDTLPSMAAAQAIYEELGFVDAEPYVFNPHQGVRYMALEL